MTVRAPAKNFNFKKFEMPEGLQIFVARAKLDRETSMAVIDRQNLFPVTYQVIIPALDANPALKEVFKGKSAWLDGEEIGGHLNGRNNWANSGTLFKAEVMEPEKLVNVTGGDEPIKLHILDDETMKWVPYRYSLSAYLKPYSPADLVVGYSFARVETVIAMKRLARME